MKKAIIALSAIAILASSCESRKQKEQLENAQALAAATQEELIQAVAERDELLDLVNEITATTDNIKQMEGMVSINLNGNEGSSTKAQVVENIEAIKATLQDRQKRLNELEQKLKDSKTSNSKLLSTIESLKQQIANQKEEVESLKLQLSDANKQIARLGGTVDSLSTTVKNVSSQRDSAETVAKEQEALANACYYAIGSKAELKENGILDSGGFLKKSKIDIASANKNFFTRADVRTLNEIPLHSAKAKVITNYQPKNSYEIVDVNGQKVLRILNPAAFWSASKYLVIQID